MGLMDTERRETQVDRHDHNTVYEGNFASRRISAGQTTQMLVIICLVLIVLVIISFMIKCVAEKCIRKVIRAVRREVDTPPSV